VLFQGMRERTHRAFSRTRERETAAD
jgi:hypothetical protein